MNGASSGAAVASAVVVAAGLAAGGALAGSAPSRARLSDRSVTVKGIPERDVRADAAIWPLRLVSADNDLTQANRQLAAAEDKVKALARHGIPVSDAAPQGIPGRGRLRGSSPPGRAGCPPVLRGAYGARAIGEAGRRLAASQAVSELIQEGVVLSTRGGYEASGPIFLFTGLNAVKPPMIAEATARGREAAEQFARDSKSGLAGIRRATQGLFEILPRDQAPGIRRKGSRSRTVSASFRRSSTFWSTSRRSGPRRRAFHNILHNISYRT